MSGRLTYVQVSTRVVVAKDIDPYRVCVLLRLNNFIVYGDIKLSLLPPIL